MGANKSQWPFFPTGWEESGNPLEFSCQERTSANACEKKEANVGGDDVDDDSEEEKKEEAEQKPSSEQQR